MLSYLHGYHAGNAADVLKHSTLAFCLAYLKKKEKPLLCVDTHAGAGIYHLGDGSDPFVQNAEAGSVPVNLEWKNGLGLLLAGLPAGLPGGLRTDVRSGVPAGMYPKEAMPAMAAEYIRVCSARQPGKEEPLYDTKLDEPAGPVAAIKYYNGSPLVMAKILEKGDRLVCYELHPAEFDTLSKAMANFRNDPVKGNPAIEVRREDGLQGLKSLLPPPSRRALVFIDPSWEDKSELESISRTLEDALGRFPQGTYIIWYPLLARPKEKTGVSVGDTLFSLFHGERCRVELYTAASDSRTIDNSPRGMYGSGLVIFNPPWTLRPALEESMPYYAKVLGSGAGGWKLEWE